MLGVSSTLQFQSAQNDWRNSNLFMSKSLIKRTFAEKQERGEKPLFGNATISKKKQTVQQSEETESSELSNGADLIRNEINEQTQGWELTQARMRLDQYKKSNKLVKLIQEKLDQEQKGYLQTKLGAVDQTYASHLASQLEGSMHSTSDFLQDAYYQANDNVRTFTPDSLQNEEELRTLGNPDVIPSNLVDKHDRHHSKAHFALADYFRAQGDRLQQQETLVNMWNMPVNYDHIPDIWDESIQPLNAFVDNKVMQMHFDTKQRTLYGEQEKDLDAFEFDRVSTHFIGHDEFYTQFKTMREGRYFDAKKWFQTKGLVKPDRNKQLTLDEKQKVKKIARAVMDEQSLNFLEGGTLLGENELYEQLESTSEMKQNNQGKAIDGIITNYLDEISLDDTQIEALSSQIEKHTQIKEYYKSGRMKISIRKDLEQKKENLKDITFKSKEAKEEALDELQDEHMDLLSYQKSVNKEKRRQFNEYDLAYQTVKLNTKKRAKLAGHVNNLRDKFVNLQNIKKNTVRSLNQFYNDNVGQSVAPGEKLKFVDSLNQQDKQTKKANLLKQIQDLTQLRKLDKLEEDSKNPQVYENELKIVSKLALLLGKSERSGSLQEFQFLFDCLQQNDVEFTANIKARVFEYATLNGSYDLANDMLKQLANAKATEQLSQIDADYLKKYFKKCLQNDKLDGVGFLVNYVDRYDVNCGNWDINLFRSALNYYLNDKFDLQKVMIFCKFYSRFFTSRRDMVNRMLNANDPADSLEEKFVKAEQIFAPYHDVVDMAALQNYLIQKIGKQNSVVIDHVTKKDVIWEMIEHFTQDKEFYEMSQMFPNATIREEDIAMYLENHFDNKNTLQKTFSVAQRIDSEVFCRKILANIQKYQSKNYGKLPRSFKKDQMKDLYIKLKATNQLQNFSASKELMLYLLKENNLLAEVIDFSEILKENKSVSTDITHYYVSETLMQTPLRMGITYDQAIDQVLQSDNQVSSCETIQKCKALFLDKGPKAAVDFMNDEIKLRQKQKKAREDFLVELFEKSFPDAGEESFIPSYQDFKEKYVVSQSLASQLAKETLAADKLETIIKEKSYDEIDRIFKYYTLLREEHNLVAPEMHFGLCVDNPALLQVDIDPSVQEQVDSVRKRRSYIEHNFAKEELELIQNYIKTLEDSKMDVLAGQQIPQLNYMKKIFEGYSLNDADEISKAADYFEKMKEAPYDERGVDRSSQTLEKYHYKVQKLFKMMKIFTIQAEPSDLCEGFSGDDEQDQIMSANSKRQRISNRSDGSDGEDQESHVETVNDNMENEGSEMWEEPDEVMTPKQQQNALDAFTQDPEFEEFQKAQHFNYIDSEWNPDVERAIRTVNMMKMHGEDADAGNRRMRDVKKVNQYREAYNHHIDPEPWNSADAGDILRSAKDLTLIEMREEMLEAVTGRKKSTLPIALEIFKKLRNQKVPTFSLKKNAQSTGDQSVEDLMHTLELLLDDNRSPIISTIRHTQKYKNQNMEQKLKAYIDSNLSREFHDTQIDLDSIISDREKLDLLTRETAKIVPQLEYLEKKISQEKAEIQKSKMQQRYKDWQKQNDHKINTDFDNKMQRLYDEFIEMRKEGHILSRDQKLSLMRNTLRVEQQAEGSNDFSSGALIPAFYAQDLIMFGVKRNYPDAVRMGEKLLINSGDKMPRDLHHSVKNYMLKHSDSYYSKESMARSGPLDSAALYGSQDMKEQSIFCLEDPYWRELIQTNQKREDIFRTPSIYSWNHKKDGLLGEIIDMEALRRKEELLIERMGM